MKELFDLLERQERKVLIVLSVLLFMGLFFLQVIALPKKKSYSHSVQTLPLQQKEYAQIKEANNDIKMEWLQWDEAKRDIADIEQKYFYRGNTSINQMRRDIRKIFQAANVQVVSDMLFDYADWEEEVLKRVRVNFSLGGSYYALKRFIHLVEIHPKFLMIERIDFRDVDTQSGRVELNIVLAGYYEK